MAFVWIVQSTGDLHFPVRICIEQDGTIVFSVRAQEAWPGSKGNVFCIRDESSHDEVDLFDELERVPVLHFDRFGKSLQIILDRPTRKRCEFLILQKRYKNRPGTYDQIFFKTQTAQKAHKSRSKVSLYPVSGPLTVVIDSAERYPWRFPKANVERRKLPAGDYALVEAETILAIVERKTFDNLVSDFDRIRIIHQSLQELATLPHPAVVIEAYYGDFMNTKKLDGRYPASHGYRVLSELQAIHPTLPFIFAGTRKEANLWTYGYFRAVSRLHFQQQESLDNTLTAEPVVPYVSSMHLENRILQVLRDTPGGLTAKEMQDFCPDADTTLIKRILLLLKKRELITASREGSRNRWYIDPSNLLGSESSKSRR
ncbi:MAG: ERCC4 domain-containing protein [Rectinema sp.]|jgi:hypothetical protein